MLCKTKIQFKMGQTLKTAASGSEGKKVEEIGPIIEECYQKYTTAIAGTARELSSADFYHAVCQTVEEINKKLGSTQFRVPKTKTLEDAYEKHHKGKGKNLTKEEFQKILQEVILDDTGLTGFGAREIFFYLFGVPATALFIKQRVAPKALPDEFFIPIVTSATVYILAKLNKI